MTRLSPSELEAGLDLIRRSPTDAGVLELIVRRPETDRREVLAVAQLDLVQGLVGDKWALEHPWRSSRRDSQLTLMNARVIALVAQEKDRWPLAGDQLYVDLDLGDANLPAGTRLTLGSAVIEVTALPHTACRKFGDRFGLDAVKFVNSLEGRELHLRGVNAKVVQPGVIRVGGGVRKVGCAGTNLPSE